MLTCQLFNKFYKRYDGNVNKVLLLLLLLCSALNMGIGDVLGALVVMVTHFRMGLYIWRF